MLRRRRFFLGIRNAAKRVQEAGMADFDDADEFSMAAIEAPQHESTTPLLREYFVGGRAGPDVVEIARPSARFGGHQPLQTRPHNRSVNRVQGGGMARCMPCALLRFQICLQGTNPTA